MGWHGSVLAPFAIVHDSTGVLVGQLVALEWQQPNQCMQIDTAKFDGCLPPIVTTGAHEELFIIFTSIIVIMISDEINH